MRKTYKYNGIIIGLLLGALVYAKTKNSVLGIIVAVAGSILCFLAIQTIERMIEKGVDKAVDAASNAIKRKKAEKQAAAEDASAADAAQPEQPDQPK